MAIMKNQRLHEEEMRRKKAEEIANASSFVTDLLGGSPVAEPQNKLTQDDSPPKLADGFVRSKSSMQMRKSCELHD